jgi:pimeloyl-ACP methyl ester carboxylesterase
MSDGNRILLLHLDVDEGRVVIARNNPDDARYVVVMVPGVGMGLPVMKRLLERAEDLFRKLASGPDDDTLSVITWADYVAPRSPQEARDVAFAATGAPRLARFLTGLPVTAEHFGRWRAPARVTVIAHGYGGLVTGLAARDHDLDAAGLVFLGCAAVGAETVGGLRYKGPVYATSPDVSGDGTPVGVHGPRPDSPGFGATVLRPGPLSFQGDPVVRYLPELRRIILGEA